MIGLLNSSRFLGVLIVFATLIGAIILSIVGAYYIYEAVLVGIGQGHGHGLAEHHPTTAIKLSVLEAVDSFLFALVLLYLASGIYYLVVHPSETETSVKMPDWLQIRSVPQMKKTLLEVIVVLLAIGFLEALVEDIENLGWLLLIYPATIISIAVAVRIIPFDH